MKRIELTQMGSEKVGRSSIEVDDHQARVVNGLIIVYVMDKGMTVQWVLKPGDVLRILHTAGYCRAICN